jgi:hypothetical protein
MQKAVSPLSLPHATNGLVRPNDTIVSAHRLPNTQAEHGNALLDNLPAILALAGPIRAFWNVRRILARYTKLAAASHLVVYIRSTPIPIML